VHKHSHDCAIVSRMVCVTIIYVGCVDNREIAGAKDVGKARCLGPEHHVVYMY
jgi:hypothetical protein